MRSRAKIATAILLLIGSLLFYVVPMAYVADLEQRINVNLSSEEANHLMEIEVEH